MADRVKCINESCQKSILADTAKKTDGFCMPCVQKKEREERQKYIAENRKDIDPYLGVYDPVEIIRLHHVKRTANPLIRYTSFQGNLEDVYAQLNKFDEIYLIDLSIKKAKEGNLDYIEYVCLELSAFRSSDLSKLHKYMLDSHIYYPAIIFKDAKSDTIRKLLIRLSDDSENRNHILLALAWSGNEDVVSIFSTWLTEPPTWSTQLYIPPHEYSKDAGWELTPKQEVRKLYFEHCYPLVPTEGSASNSGLLTCMSSDKKCKWCGGNLTNLLELDLSNHTFDFLGLTGNKVTLSTCSVCACYSESLYMDFDTQGNTTWSKFNSKPDYLPGDSDEWEGLPENCLTLSDNFRAPFYAANEFLPTSFSQIGGMPTWIQDFAYPTCPSCKNTMTFFAQISNEEIEQYGEGIYYVYICCNCYISATNYQQT